MGEPVGVGGRGRGRDSTYGGGGWGRGEGEVAQRLNNNVIPRGTVMTLITRVVCIRNHDTIAVHHLSKINNKTN